MVSGLRSFNYFRQPPVGVDIIIGQEYKFGKGVRPAGAAVSADTRNLSIPRERQSSGPRSPFRRETGRGGWEEKPSERCGWWSLSPPPHARLDRRRDPTWAVPAWRHDAVFESRGDTSFPVVTARHPTSMSMVSWTLIGECSQRKRIR